MILLSILMPAALGLTELPPQKLLPGRCVAFLWTRSETPTRLAMIDENARTLRMARGKQILDLPRVNPGVYAGHGMTVTINLEFAERQGLTNGALVEAGVMRFEVPGQESLSLPVGGMRACQ